MIAKHRPRQPIVALTPSDVVHRQLALSWGVVPLVTQPICDTDDLIARASTAVVAAGLGPRGARLVGGDGDEAIQHGLKFLGAGEDCIRELDGRDLLGRDLLAQDRGGQAGELAHFSSPRDARLRINADTPNVHGAILSQ